MLTRWDQKRLWSDFDLRSSHVASFSSKSSKDADDVGKDDSQDLDSIPPPPGPGPGSASRHDAEPDAAKDVSVKRDV